ncbi:MAG: HAD-IC family P-type ATPase [Ignavibacteria bacterium]|nr:HAD-IC family P-type ATPase [Ignavibacteria bacterium]
MITEHPIWHATIIDDVVRALDSSVSDGLTEHEASVRRQTYGPNSLPKGAIEHPVRRYMRQLNAPLVYILILAGCVTVIVSGITDAIVIFGVLILNAVIGFLQEGKATAALASLAANIQGETTAVRSRMRVRIAMPELVPGDVVLLEAGDKVPADLRLLWVKDLAIAEAVLTGKSVPSEKHTAVLEATAQVADRTNMAYASTVVVRGSAKGVVVATGTRTEVGTISALLDTAPQLQTPLTRQIAKFSSILLYAIIGLAAVTFLVGIARGNTVVDMLIVSVALSVGAVPEGLPAAVTIILAIGVNRMAKRRAIIRKLPAVETLGSTTVICSDKTGTLTENQMTVVEIATAGHEYDVEGTGYEPEGYIVSAMGGADTVSTVHTRIRCSPSRDHSKRRPLLYCHDRA